MDKAEKIGGVAFAPAREPTLPSHSRETSFNDFATLIASQSPHRLRSEGEPQAMTIHSRHDLQVSIVETESAERIIKGCLAGTRSPRSRTHHHQYSGSEGVI